MLYSLGGIFDAAIFVLYRNAEPITQFAQFRGKRLSIGMPGTALRSLILQVLKATDALDASAHLADLEPTDAIDALIAGEIDVAIVPQLDQIGRAQLQSLRHLVCRLLLEKKNTRL